MDTFEQKEVKLENEIQNTSNKANKTKEIYNWGTGLGFLGVIICLVMGFYKMFAYENNSGDDSYFSDLDSNINAYVGGDAYNYIINASYATGYFVLALMFMVFACTLMIIKSIKK